MATYWSNNKSLVTVSGLTIFLLAVCPLRCWAEDTLPPVEQEQHSSSGADKGSDLNSAKVGDQLIVRPIVRELRTGRRIRSIGYADHAEQLIVSFHELPSTVLDLQLNRDLIPDDFYVRHHVNGSEDWQPEGFADNPLPVCHYSGTVRDMSNSWVTLSMCFGLSGAVFDGVHLFYIESLYDSVDGDHSWIKHSQDLRSTRNRCDEDHHKSVGWLVNNESIKVKRQTESNQLTTGVHNVELVLVVDYAIYQRNHGDMYRILKRVFDIVNVIKQIYSSLQISVILMGVIVWSAGDKIHMDKNLSHTLSNFKMYQNAHLEIKMHDSAHLMTGVDGSYFGGPVGRAYVGTLCNAHDSCGIAVDDAKSPAAMTASIMAHEMGHNFGMHHDDSCQCPLGDCVMAAAIGQPTMHWSSCSHQLIQDATRQARYSCLRNRPSRCGDMVLDPEEECDCGLPNYCWNQCCDPHTCKFSQRSLKVQCADGGCCNLMTCQWELPGVECRPAENECDLPEYCFGDGPSCPSDLHKYNGIKCQPRKVCIDRKCSADQSGRNNRPFQCPTNCTNGGFCNNLGKCHCPDGYNPPHCQHYGMGGSEDGGPALDPKVRRLFQIELYVFFLAVVPIAAFLFFVFYFFLDDERKELFWSICRRCGRGGNKGFANHLYPVPLIQSTSVDKTMEEPREKRDFSVWVKNRVRLTLPSIISLPVNGPFSSILSPASGCSTASITLSSLNTPETSLSTPDAFLALPPTMEDKKQLIRPAARIIRTALPLPPLPPHHAVGVAKEDVAVDSAKSAKNKFPLSIPPSSAKAPLL